MPNIVRKLWSSVISFMAVTLTAQTASLPNLTPYQPLGWSDKIAISITPGGTIDDDVFTTWGTLSIRYAVINTGNIAMRSGFYVSFYLDNVLYTTIDDYSALAPGQYSSGSVITLPRITVVGTHTIRMVIDPGGYIQEANENDN